MKKPALWRTLAAAAALALAGAAQAAVTYGSNLVVNGDAEAGTAGWLGYSGYSTIQAVDYGNNWVRPDQPGPADRGQQMFTGTGAFAVGYQLLDLGDALDAPLAYQLSGWLGGWLAQQDNALFYVQFLDAAGTELGSASLGPVTPAERGNATGLWLREAEGWVPAGTQQLGFWLSMERLGGGDNDGYADNLSFILAAPAAVPEPGGLALTGVGLGLGLIALATRQRRAG